MGKSHDAELRRGETTSLGVGHRQSARNGTRGRVQGWSEPKKISRSQWPRIKYCMLEKISRSPDLSCEATKRTSSTSRAKEIPVPTSEWERSRNHDTRAKIGTEDQEKWILYNSMSFSDIPLLSLDSSTSLLVNKLETPQPCIFMPVETAPLSLDRHDLSLEELVVIDLESLTIPPFAAAEQAVFSTPSHSVTHSLNRNSDFLLLRYRDTSLQDYNRRRLLRCDLKDALIAHLKSLDIKVEELGSSSYYSIAAASPPPPFPPPPPLSKPTAPSPAAPALASP
ncbi:hypothetical protein TIFTF001_000902 [Ficus carica]|uniref:Uncharacterized protein n=1 Tax=Ficus carica TaxID=3494 RepID=A0AA87YXK9_FICCA|nr:hypothetical protein TIFTF001_000902 [Ficus carica]